MLIRIPMRSEVEDVIRLTDISLNSEMVVLEALDAEAKRQSKVHQVILMADMGDLREGYWDKEEMADVAVYVENELTNLKLIGIGTNVGCYGSIAPTVEKLEELGGSCRAYRRKTRTQTGIHFGRARPAV